MSNEEIFLVMIRDIRSGLSNIEQALEHITTSYVRSLPSFKKILSSLQERY